MRIMQPNLPQDEKFNYTAKTQVMERYLALSNRVTGPQSKGVHDFNILIWPESAFPFFLTREPDALAQIASLLKPHTALITGAVRAASSPELRVTRAYNSVYVIDPDGSIHGVYDKVHLVPFGEYLPFQHLLERLGLRQLTKMVGGFLAGERRRIMDVPGAPKMLPLICYEAIFPAAAVPRGERPGWLVNVTNDGWFGISSGPHQHFQQARVHRHRRRPAAGARGQYRNFRGDRSARPYRQRIAAGRRRRARFCAADTRSRRRFMSDLATTHCSCFWQSDCSRSRAGACALRLTATRP